RPATPGAPAAAAAPASFSTRTVTAAAATQARHAAAAHSTYSPVRGGDTLSKIANSYYHNADDWQYLYHENDKTVSDPNLIYVGQRLMLSATAPAHYTLANYVAKHAKAAQRVASTVSETSRGSESQRGAAPASADGSGKLVTQSAAQGMYS